MNNKINQMKYQPISCSLYDRIESLAVLNKKIRLVYQNEKLLKESVIGRIHNIFSKEKAEYLEINNIQVRLDNIVSILEEQESDEK